MNYLLLFLLVNFIATNSNAAGGELGNGRPVVNPLAGIKTLLPNDWGYFDGFGSVKFFDLDTQSFTKETSITLDYVNSGYVSSIEDLRQFTQNTFLEYSTKFEMKFYNNSTLVFAHFSDPANQIVGCFWKRETDQHLCMKADYNSQTQSHIKMIINNLDFVE